MKLNENGIKVIKVLRASYFNPSHLLHSFLFQILPQFCKLLRDMSQAIYKNHPILSPGYFHPLPVSWETIIARMELEEKFMITMEFKLN